MRLYARENRFAQATYRSFAAALPEAFSRDVTDALIHHLYYRLADADFERCAGSTSRGIRALRPPTDATSSIRADIPQPSCKSNFAGLAAERYAPKGRDRGNKNTFRPVVRK